MLLMKREFFDAIKAGTKTTTLRYWRWAMVKPGTVHNVRGLGQVRIDDVKIVDFASLKKADAQADGFANLAELRLALEMIYPPDKRTGRKLYLVRFSYLPYSSCRRESGG